MVFAAEFDELWHARHRAVFIHDFADDAGRIETGDARQVHGGFGLSGTNEHAAITSTQGEHVPRASEIMRTGLRVNRRQDGYSAVGSADAGGHANLGVNGFAEG